MVNENKEENKKEFYEYKKYEQHIYVDKDEDLLKLLQVLTNNNYSILLHKNDIGIYVVNFVHREIEEGYYQLVENY